MPGRRNTTAVDPSLCRRCQADVPAITVRNEPLCEACFCKYVSTKIVKRMETFRVRHSEPDQSRTLLLPLSFGASSSSLLSVLSQHLKGQAEKTGRTGFGLHVLHVEDDVVSSKRGDAPSMVEKVKSRFPEHTYSTSTLSDVLSYKEITPSTGLLDDNSLASMEDLSNHGRLERILASLDSATSRTDMLRILQRKFIVAFAKQHNCEAVLWGDSTTRLAERTLAETAKGRGVSLPWIVADGESPYGIPFYYPVRELLSKEIASFASLVVPPLDDLILKDNVQPVVSTKNTTIDQLMKQYFESVEKGYPSIVANVVRTTGKLEMSALSEVEKQCELCDMPLEAGRAPEKSRLCYGCLRTLSRPVG